MTEDGMTPLITVTDSSTAYLIAEALRSQADANRRTADRLMSPAYNSIAGVNARHASRLSGHAQRLDALATEVERQGHALDSWEADTVVMSRVVPLSFLP